MPADIQNIKIGVNLIDDYLLTQEAPVANGLTRDLFTVVQNHASAESASELLTINRRRCPCALLSGLVVPIRLVDDDYFRQAARQYRHV